ncbi:hypothetical protein NDU88_007732 [Pleurodeles waltl]|uniref:Uncharacterized protein n=1 Tax=Pleurodeles waltl TaxID=8319 RepID=A0AAV7PMH4_PLEWA|nr:hypothetical protein NDU88_007732 [Pleurodeles waltl]
MSPQVNYKCKLRVEEQAEETEDYNPRRVKVVNPLRSGPVVEVTPEGLACAPVGDLCPLLISQQMRRNRQPALRKLALGKLQTKYKAAQLTAVPPV